MALIEGPIAGHTAGPIDARITGMASALGVGITGIQATAGMAIRVTVAITDMGIRPTGMVDWVADCAGGNTAITESFSLSASAGAGSSQKDDLRCLRVHAFP
jgi:hypothetical protein